MSGIINFVKTQYGDKYVPEQPRIYSVKQKLAQEAHEAIRPTKSSVLGAEVSENLGLAYGKLYDLIWRRAVASQMSNAVIESTTVFVDANPYKLKANGSVLVFDGFLKINPLGLSDNRLPQFNVSEKLNLIDVLEKEHETLPPPRYNDASIIKTLEEKGIGRPSTYATIISTIEYRSYIERVEGKFSPTAIGIAVNDFLVKNFADIDDIPFTALMENKFDEIATGQLKYVPMMKEFYTPFQKKLEKVEGAERVKIAVEETSEMCPKCGKGNLIIRTGKFGKFLACSKFPDCKFTKAFIEETDQLCPRDGGKIVVKKTRKGRKFYGCSNYPKCDFASWKLEDIKKPQENTN
jgi:DNA topoisomerase-1